MDAGKRKNRWGTLVILALMAWFVLGQYAPVQAADKTSGSITLNKAVYILEKGKTIKLKAELNKAAGIPLGAKKPAVIWKSSDPETASVSGNGKVTAKKNGKATITARIRGTRVMASSRIIVGTPVSKIKLSGESVSLKVGERYTLKAAVSPKRASVKKLTYESSNPKAAAVSKKGVIRAISAGTAKIRVTAADGSGKKAYCTVTVTESAVTAVPVSSVVLNKTRLNLKQGGREQLAAAVEPSNAADKSVKWESSNQAVAEVSDNGTVTAVAEGTAVITASAHNNVRAFCTVTVEPVSGQPEEPENPENPEQPEDSEKILVVYFGTPVQERSGQVDGISSASRTATGETFKGNTEYIAEMISRETGADLFEIVPETAYADIYETVRDLAQQEQQQNARPAIKNEISNFSQYDTVYVGYPIWWSDMPQILYTFFDTYNFSGKNIIPFSTHAGSGLSGTVER